MIVNVWKLRPIEYFFLDHKHHTLNEYNFTSIVTKCPYRGVKLRINTFRMYNVTDGACNNANFFSCKPKAEDKHSSK